MVITLDELRRRYEDYKAAVFLLAASHQTVKDRKDAIAVRDEFEKDIRDGILDELFTESENWQ